MMRSVRARKNTVAGMATFEQMERRRLFSGTGHHDLVDVDGPNHEANDNGAVHVEAVHHHRGQGNGGPATKHNDAVDND